VVYVQKPLPRSGSIAFSLRKKLVYHINQVTGEKLRNFIVCEKIKCYAHALLVLVDRKLMKEI